MVSYIYADLERLCLEQDKAGIESILSRMGFVEDGYYLKRKKDKVIDYIFMEQDGTYTLTIPNERSSEFEPTYRRFKSCNENQCLAICFISGMVSLFLGT